MADWLKLNHSLVRSPKVRGLMRALRCKKHAALGLAVAWLCWVDEQTTDGQTGLSPDELDDEIGFRGCAEALISIGWAALGVDGLVYAVEFGKHCGETAKKRALNNTRKANQRARDAEMSRILRDKSHAECHADCVSRIEENNNNTVVGRDTGDIKGAGEPARTTILEGDDGFKVWLAGLCGAHPSARRSRVLQPDVLEAAQDAYKRCPDAVEHVELLEAYFGSKQSSDRNKLAFYRPTGQRKFFVDLEDVLCHAERWQREFGWGKKQPKRGKTVETPGTQVQRCGGVLYGAEAMDFIRGETDEL